MLHQVHTSLTRIRRFAFSVLQAGTTVLCLICGWKGRKFIKGGICPVCGSRARHRLIPYSIMHFQFDISSGPFLHVGPNVDEAAFIFKHYLPKPYYRMDIASRGLVNLPGDLRAIPLEGNTIQHLLIWHVLEHIAEDRAAIQEMYRVLRCGGRLLVSVPIYPPGRAETFEDPSVPRERFREVFGHEDHVRACGLDYFTRFEEVGFQIKRLAVCELPDAETAFFGLSKAHVAWCCTK